MSGITKPDEFKGCAPEDAAMGSLTDEEYAVIQATIRETDVFRLIREGDDGEEE